MNSRPQNSGSHAGSASSAAVALIEAVTDYDTNTAAWVEFDAQMSAKLAALEQQLQQYWTPQAVCQSLRR